MRSKAISLLAAAFSLGVMQAASAADMPTKAPIVKAPVAVAISNWTGCYIGANGGGGWSEKKFTNAQGLDEGSHTANGFAAGGQIGCDYQFAPQWVVGIQGMYDWAHLTGSNASVAFPLNTLHTTVRSFGTVTGRLGYLLNPTLLFYGKGGFAWADDRFFCDGAGNGACLAQTGGLGYSASGTRSGWDAGVGLSWMFMPNWNVWVEYDHLGLGDKTLTFTSNNGNGFFFKEGIRQRIDKVLVGVDYRFTLTK